MSEFSDEKHAEPLALFGGKKDWSADDWTASDDRVRGGKSQSYLDASDKKIGRFYGNLDIKTLGGAGFASQRTTGDDREYDLSKYAGIELRIAKGDKKRYTFIFKDERLPPNPENGREQATISYEADFELPPQTVPGDAHDRYVSIPFKSLNPTYRGKLKKDAQPLKTSSIKRMSIMMRSFFGTQEGDFSLSIRSITAVAKAPEHNDPLLSIQANERKLEAGTMLEAVDEQDARYYSCRAGIWPVHVNLRVHKHVVTALICVLGWYVGHKVATWYLIR
ncbi:hypothetical protein B0A50_08109 [Salinomyces thailandicus]|uniref:NADH:ubiquinone oxidoreductase intermediate-associated protein 30 domain-containing protein n=1 Tax=Salinomyces thailandicus TaxID=706561 RepID=A0A4U0TK52_9PEZI|nr:hypothetical protein B0A50_08109 [Salinomyces thailandica]